MYAVIKSGGKQYRVESGATLRIEALPADVGAAVSFDQVLLVGAGEGVKVGAPLVSGALVRATVLGHGRGDNTVDRRVSGQVRYAVRGENQNSTVSIIAEGSPA